MTLSEGGLGLEAPLRIEQGDSLRICILPHRKSRAVRIEGIAWNDRPSRSRAGKLRSIGVVVSDPPEEFLALLREVERKNPSSGRAAGAARTAGRPSTPPRRADPTPCEDLPRSRAPMPPPKPEPEENLHNFRVRLKLVGGPRTRIFAVQASSVGDAEERARAELATSAKPDEQWELLEVTAA